MIPVLSWDFYLYGNSREKVNISWVTAGLHTLWEAGHRVTRIQGLAHARALGGEKITRVPGLVQDSRFRGESLENEWKSRNGAI